MVRVGARFEAPALFFAANHRDAWSKAIGKSTSFTASGMSLAPDGCGITAEVMARITPQNRPPPPAHPYVGEQTSPLELPDPGHRQPYTPVLYALDQSEQDRRNLLSNRPRRPPWPRSLQRPFVQDSCDLEGEGRREQA